MKAQRETNPPLPVPRPTVPRPTALRAYAPWVSVVTLLLTLAAAGPAGPVSAEAGKRTAKAATADDLMVVDCLLPGVLRRIGNRTFPSPRRPLRTTAVDCRIRGGEYTAYDRADYRTALSVWLVEAEGGDPEAEYYVGQIYEQGLGREPDYAKAAEWYARAAEQGYAPAQNSLGFLYEQGLGVEEDPAAALALYRRASGLPDDVVLLQGSDYRQLLEELAAGRRDVSELEAQLRDAEERLAAERTAGGAAHAEVERLQQRLDAELTAKRRAVASLSKRLEDLQAGADRPPPRPVRDEDRAAPAPAPAERDVLAGLDYGPYRALVIANSEYRHLDPLPGVVEEARDLADLMRQRYGFETEVLENASRYQILSALNELREELTESHNLVLFYAGRSVSDEAGQRSWWQPVDAEADSRANWISNRVLSDHLDLIAARHVLLVADAGFAGTLSRSSVPQLPSGMTGERRAELVREMLQRRVRLVLAAASGGGGERPSPFLRTLVQVLRESEGVVDASTVYRRVCELLAAGAAPAAEIPEFAPIRWARTDGGSDFFFVPRDGRRSGS